MEHLWKRKVAWYAHYSLLSLLALFFPRLTEYYWRYLTFRADPKCWPQPGPGARCPGRWHPTALGEEDADVSNRRARQLIRSTAVCSLSCHQGVGTLVRKGCIIQYFYGFLLYPSVFFRWLNQMDCLISDICGISHLHGQVLRVVECSFPAPPPTPMQDPNLVCSCPSRIYLVQKGLYLTASKGVL